MQAGKHSRPTRAGALASSRALRVALWVLVVLSPVLSVLVLGVASGTSVLAIDAWNTSWNDEQSYYHAVRQMLEVGEPSGVVGYNEVAALRPTYGPYNVVVYAPYLLGALLAGVAAHNFMYIVNMALGVAACVILIVVLRPSARESLLCAAFFFFQFIVARYLCSGMIEASFALFAVLFASCALYALRHAGGGGSAGLVVAALVAMMLAVGFWGVPRPFILALMLAPWLMLAFADFGLRGWQRAVLAALGLAVAVAGLAAFLYYSKYYATPYFGADTMADSLTGRMLDELSALPGKHVECVLYAASKLAKLDWLGVVVFGFAAGWVVLAVLFVLALRRGERARAALYAALLLAGLAVFEAHLLLYSYKQMHRTMLYLVIIYTLVIVWHGAPAPAPVTGRGAHGARVSAGGGARARVRTGAAARGEGGVPALAAARARASRAGQALPASARALPIAFVAVLSALSIGCLAADPSEFALPQASERMTAEADAELAGQLEELMPRSADAWDNTVAHPVEGGNIRLYFQLPPYMNLNTLQGGYLKKAVKKGTLKSKYVCLPNDAELNELLSRSYEVLYRGRGHIIYRVRG